MRGIDIRKLIVALGVVQILTMLIALGAIVAAVILTTNGIQTSRRDGRVDSCYLIRGIALKATPPARYQTVLKYLNGTELGNCDSYGRDAG